MASTQTLTGTLFIFSLLTISYAATDPSKLPKNTFIHFPIRKNQTTLQYYTSFQPVFPTIVDAVIDLGARSIWFDCTSYVSSSYNRATCGSNRCKKASGSVCLGCNSALRPGCSNNTCGVYAYNPFTEYLTAQELGEDTIRVSSTDDVSDEYFISVKDIEINGKPVAFDSSLLSFCEYGIGGTKISTIIPYTTLHSVIYKRVVKDFVKAAAAVNIKRVKSVAPFGACFDSKTAPKMITGAGVPDIDLVLEGKGVRFC
ncbi:hypothetical protein SSX86_026381 [Deinandra increscens subsp. villosa]|uniref:Uncharacterized protein n=1 Tax=Deinandra increscens subsp. villosa TaxID=3103831 RepID=A0AAP0CLA1_9ASTR